MDSAHLLALLHFDPDINFVRKREVRLPWRGSRKEARCRTCRAWPFQSTRWEAGKRRETSRWRRQGPRRRWAGRRTGADRGCPWTETAHCARTGRSPAGTGWDSRWAESRERTWTARAGIRRSWCPMPPRLWWPRSWRGKLQVNEKFFNP